jgi:hypothetical protein
MWINIFDGFIFDIHGFAGIFKGVQGFLKVRFGGAYTCDHVGIRVST